MAYGRQFEFRATPNGAQRAARYYLDGASDVVIGAPVVLSTSGENSQGQLAVRLATSTADKTIPLPGKGGILVYEWAPVAFRGDDANLTTYSDKDYAPAGEAVQVISGKDVKVAYKNVQNHTTFPFKLRASYPRQRVMIPTTSLGATPTLVVGDFLTPGAGTDSGGYWVETSNATEAWLIVTHVNATTDEVEAVLNFG